MPSVRAASKSLRHAAAPMAPVALVEVPRHASPSVSRPSLEVAPQFRRQPPDVGGVYGRIGGLALRRPVGEARPDPGFAQRPEIFVGVFRSADVVAPVVDGGRAREDRLGSGEACALVHVARQVFLAQLAGGGEVAVLGPIPRHAAEERVPHVPVRLDQSREHDHPACVDHLRPRRFHARADCHDAPRAYVHAAVRNVHRSRLHGHHVAVADEILALRGQAPAGAWPGAGASGYAQGAERHCAAQKRAP